MAKHSLYDWYSQLPPVGKAVVGIGTVVAAGAIGIGIWNAIKQAKQTSANLKEAKDAVVTLNQLAQKGIVASYPDSQFEVWSNELAQAFSGCGTDTTTVYNIISALNNEADLYKLIATYGTRSYDGCKWLLQGAQTKSLSAAISDELSTSEKDRVNGALARFSFTFA